MVDFVKFGGDVGAKFERFTLIDQNGVALVDENNESLQGTKING